MKNCYYLPTKFGTLKIVEEEEYLTEVTFIKVKEKVEQGRLTSLMEEVIKQLREYEKGERKIFTLPLKVRGTSFREKVWRELQNIPYAQTISYAELAKRIGNPKASRAVGMANHHNPIAIIIPCHRVIGANGKLVGYGGGLDKKEMLLEWEQINGD